MAILKGGSYVGGDFVVANNLIAGGTLTSTGNIYTNGAVYTNGKANTGDEDLSGLATYSYVNNTFLPMVGGTMTGQITLLAGASGGLKFPDNAFGGGGDLASITILNPSGGESTEMTFTMGNDADDIVNFSMPSINGVKVNHNTVWNAGNAGTTAYDWTVRSLNTASIITMPVNQQIRWADNSSMIYGTDSNLNFTGVATFSSNVNAVGYGNFGTTRTNAYLKLYGLNALAGYDGWLRVNDGDPFPNGIYCGSTTLRIDGALQVGDSGSFFNVSSNGATKIASTLTVLDGIYSQRSVADHYDALNLYNTYAYGDSNRAETRINLGKIEGGTTYQNMGAIGAGPNNNGDSTYGYLTFYSRDAGSLGERMRLTSNGHLLIGTTVDSTYKLDIAGTLRSSGVANFNNSLYTTGSTYTTGGFLAGGNIYSGGKNDLNDGIHGVILSKAGGIEISGGSPLIDFHFNNSTNDFTSRIIEMFSGQLSFDSKIRIGDIYIQNPNNEALYVNGNTYGTGEIKTNSQFTYGTYAYSKYNTITKSIDFIFN